MSNVNPYVSAICDKCKQPKNTQYHLVLEKRFVCKDENSFRSGYTRTKQYYICDECLCEFNEWFDVKD